MIQCFKKALKIPNANPTFLLLSNVRERFQSVIAVRHPWMIGSVSNRYFINTRSLSFFAIKIIEQSSVVLIDSPIEMGGIANRTRVFVRLSITPFCSTNLFTNKREKRVPSHPSRVRDQGIARRQRHPMIKMSIPSHRVRRFEIRGEFSHRHPARQTDPSRGGVHFGSACLHMRFDQSRNPYPHANARAVAFRVKPVLASFICGTIAEDEGSIAMSFTVLRVCAIQLADGDFVGTVRSVSTIMLFRYGQFHSA